MRGLDRVFAWAAGEKNGSYALVYPLEQQTFRNTLPELTEFAKQHGYFSKDPLLGYVTDSQKDIDMTLDLLQTIYQKITDPAHFTFTTGEVIAKILAYRDLKEGMQVPLPFIARDGKPRMAIYEVDRVFDLWHGMPAYGLVPQGTSEAVPILLYRGTDLTVTSVRGWASIASDLDLQGTGLSVFRNGQAALHRWLQKNKARVLGFSLGGILAAYTILYEGDLVASEPNQPSLAFNPPGVSQAVREEWEKKFASPPSHFVTYVNRGDFVPKIGFLVGGVFECAKDKRLMPLVAHNIFLSAQRTCRLYRVDTSAENETRK